MKRRKKLKKEIEDINKKLEEIRREKEEIEHMLLVRINNDIKSIGKLIKPLVNGMCDMEDRVKALEEEKEAEAEIDKTIDDMFS